MGTYENLRDLRLTLRQIKNKLSQEKPRAEISQAIDAVDKRLKEIQDEEFIGSLTEKLRYDNPDQLSIL